MTCIDPASVWVATYQYDAKLGDPSHEASATREWVVRTWAWAGSEPEPMFGWTLEPGEMVRVDHRINEVTHVATNRSVTLSDDQTSSDLFDMDRWTRVF